MIALQTLKYKIFEWCLDTLIDKLVNNFCIIDIDKNKKELDVSEIQVGMKIDEIICIRHDWIVHKYRGCKIILKDEKISSSIGFSYELIKLDTDITWSISSGLPTYWTIGENIHNNGVHFYRYLL